MTAAPRKVPWLRISIPLVIAATLAVIAPFTTDPKLYLSCAVVCCFWAAWVYDRWRETAPGSATTQGHPEATWEDPRNAGTVHGLVPDAVYWVQQTFTDYYGNQFLQGERLQFKTLHFLPYHGGYTIFFAERELYLQEEENRDILGRFSQYIAPREQE